MSPVLGTPGNVPAMENDHDESAGLVARFLEQTLHNAIYGDDDRWPQPALELLPR